MNVSTYMCLLYTGSIYMYSTTILLCFCDTAQMNEESEIKIEPQHGKTNKMACAPREDSDQHGHLPSLIIVFVVHSIGS